MSSTDVADLKARQRLALNTQESQNKRSRNLANKRSKKVENELRSEIAQQAQQATEAHAIQLHRELQYQQQLEQHLEQQRAQQAAEVHAIQQRRELEQQLEQHRAQHLAQADALQRDQAQTRALEEQLSQHRIAIEEEQRRTQALVRATFGMINSKSHMNSLLINSTLEHPVTHIKYDIFNDHEKLQFSGQQSKNKADLQRLGWQ